MDIRPVSATVSDGVTVWRFTYVAKIVLARRTKRRHKLISPWEREKWDRRYAQVLRRRTA